MKLLCVIGTLQAGGAERVLSILSNALVQYNYEVIIVTFDSKEPFYDLDRKISVVNLELEPYGSSIVSKIIGMYKQVDALKGIVIRENPNILISYITEVNILSIITAKLTNIPIISAEHTNYIRKKPIFWKVLRRLIYPFSNTLVTLTNFDKNHYSFVKNKKVLPNPLNITHNHSSIKREKIILGVGRLIELKGFDRLIEAFHQLKSYDWKLVIIGEGEQRKNLENLIIQRGLEGRVILEGLVKDVEIYYKKASIYVLSSRIEGYPMGLCEAMGYGCASIAFDILTGPSDIIIQNKNGILVRDNDIHQLVVEIQYLINNPIKREELSKEAQKIKIQLGLEVISKQWIDMIEKIKE